MFSIVLLFSLISLAMGLLVLLKTKKYNKNEVAYCVWGGYLIVVLSIVMLLFAAYQGFRMYSYQVQAHTMMMQNQAAAPMVTTNNPQMKKVRSGKHS